MKQRWYDNDPTLSMAISLLQNASKTHQEMAARYMFQLMQSRGLMDRAELRTKDDRVRFIFPSFRRSRFEMHARHLVELMKHLNASDQQDMALQLINYIYILDCGMEDFSEQELEEVTITSQHEESAG
jgi:hypothetical protein